MDGLIGRNRRNSLTPVLSYCCSLAVVIVTADLPPRPSRWDGSGYCVYLQNLIRLQLQLAVALAVVCQFIRHALPGCVSLGFHVATGY